ncbi:DUF559 domain-containing protein [Litoreibacter ponti]|uniref:DUF559 domain-containing protein n=1 Tax=Litoreibacter ponti TaxID=1510457 RepID=UPI000D317A18|nr:DUF559 domain-containing protein [Litoreibacter ponti]
MARLTTRKARTLRRWMTEPEDQLWQLLRNRKLDNLKFRRKAPLGNLVVDFLCVEAGLVVEITGKGQFTTRLEKRDARLIGMGFGVLRLPREQLDARPEQALRQIARAARRRCHAPVT